ncbi:uncharacterized protein [Watersipora subatra]|uniref:uncharacterized protein n=1 Tax=Watersipora subatra TaxID=2589382 RepID=UPI00355BA612
MSVTNGGQRFDTEHLATQAIKLFSKRYGKAFDTHIDVRRSGLVKKEDYINFCTRQFEDEQRKKATEIAEKQWQAMTGGCTNEPVTQLSRNTCIELCLKGYHSTDIARRESLKQMLIDIGNFHFDLIDTDHDGFITPEEWASWTRMLGNADTWKGAFSIMDVNGDGKIERKEWTDCFVGFFCYIDEERYSHFFGLIR